MMRCAYVRRDEGTGVRCQCSVEYVNWSGKIQMWKDIFLVIYGYRLNQVEGVGFVGHGGSIGIAARLACCE
jgi:hypothetical protein